MKKILLLSTISILAFSNELEILNKTQQELKNAEKEIIRQNYKNSKNSWISPIDLSANINRSHEFDTEKNNFSQSVSIGFSQSIFESGGIDLTIQYAQDKLNSDLINWENDTKQILQTIYETLLQIKKTKAQIEQNKYTLQNKEIELALRKIEYENGHSDIIDLNNAIMAKNDTFQQSIALKNTLKDLLFELSKNTDLKYEQIHLIDFSTVNKDDYLEKNIDLLYENSLVKLAHTSYEQTKTNYLPKISLSGDLGYSNNENLNEHTNSDSPSGSVGLRFSMPLYDINKDSTLELSRLDIIKQKLELQQSKDDYRNIFDQAITQIDSYKSQNEIIAQNIELYSELIEINEVSNSSGMTSDYDLELLENTKKINEYDLEINNINIQQEYATLYFKIKKEI